MDLSKAIENRRSVREFKPSPVEWEKLANILDAGRLAPSSGNLQDWKFIVVNNKDKKQDIADACAQQFWMADAPVFVVLVSLDDRNERYYGERGKNVYTIQNCAAAAMSMLLAVEAEGLSACWVSAFDVSMIRRILTIPDTTTPQVVIPIGYSDENPDAPNKLELQDLIFFDKYGNRFNNITEASEDYSVRIKRELDDIKGFLTKAQAKAKAKIEKELEEHKHP